MSAPEKARMRGADRTAKVGKQRHHRALAEAHDGIGVGRQVQPSQFASMKAWR